MTKHEFEVLINAPVSMDDYPTIENVYTYHPSISDVDGKRQIAAIYSLPGGMRIIRDMLATAATFADLENQERTVRAKMAELQAELDLIRETREELSK